jgi:hypothetical protein
MISNLVFKNTVLFSVLLMVSCGASQKGEGKREKGKDKGERRKEKLAGDTCYLLFQAALGRSS